MAAGLRKCIDMGPFEEGSGGDWRDIRYVDPHGVSNLTKVIHSGTRWVRIWVRWDIAMPTRHSYNHGYLAALDDQIFRCRQAGIGVVLVNWLFPRWSNYTEGVDPNTYARADRVRADGTGLKALEYGIPVAELGTDGAWGQWINHLISRYKGYSCGVLLELMNEPNHQMWPQRNSSGDVIIHQKVAWMMHTAAVVSGWHGNPMPIGAPATSDFRRTSSRYETYFYDFVLLLMDALRSFNYYGMPLYMWTHHNYKDVEEQNTNGLSQTRALIHGFWRGWSATNNSGNDPGIWVTEGGARRHLVGTYGEQARRVGDGWNRLSWHPGAAMWSNYLLHSVPDPFDTGLRNPVPDAGERPIWHTFRSFPGNA